MVPESPVVPQPPQSRRGAFQFGVIFGLVQALIAACVLFFNAFVNTNSGVALLLNILEFLTALAAYFVAGILAARQTGRMRTGTFAGLWGGAIFGIVNLVISSAVFFAVLLPKAMTIIQSMATYNPANQATYQIGAMVGGIGLYVLGGLVAVGIGSGMGALGGLIGRNISPYKAVPVVPMMPVYGAYPGQPIPYGTPMQPMQPMQADPYGTPMQPMQADPYGAPVTPAPYTSPEAYAPPASAGQIYAEQVNIQQPNPEQ